MTALFVAGAHTDIGKTHVACGLLRAARAKGLAVDAFKPVMSGFDAARGEESDAGRLLAAMGRSPTDLDAVAPWRFAAPVAPPLAARLEGAALRRAEVTAACRDWLRAHPADLVLVEGAGGVMSPLCDDGLNLDLMSDLALPVLLVGGGYLGTISHVLTALEVVVARGLKVAGVAISQDADPQAPDLLDTVAEVARRTASPVFSVRRDDAAWAGEILERVIR